jgi:pyruvate kinase
VVVKVKSNFVMEDKMKVNLPGAIIDLPSLTDKDEDDILEFGLKKDIDMVCCSFVRKASDVEYVRNVLGQKGAHVKVISKIENNEALHNFDEILAESDGVCICRADLALEIPPEKVFIAQKWMTEKANLAAKPVIIATQMFESMINSARPTRSEASDVSNAVLDGVDACLLNDETVIGDYPINAVSMLAKCCVEAEKTIDYRKAFNDLKLYSPAPYGTAESVSCAAVAAVLDLKVDLIIVLTESGKLARLVSKYRPEVPILCCSSNNNVVMSMTCQRGVNACLTKADLSIDNQI